MLEANFNLKPNLKSVIFILFGVSCATIGLKGFLIPAHFIDGGAMGIALLTNLLSGINISVLVVVFNLPFILLGVKQIGVGFAVRSGLAIGLLSIMLALIQFPEVTSDKLLISVFGGFFLGAGIGLSMRGSAVIDGTEILALLVSKKAPATVGDIILVINIIIFAVAGWLYNIETAMYAILTYLSASKTVDFILQGIEEYIGFSIISSRSPEVRDAILTELGRGVTIYKGKGGRTASEHPDAAGLEILFTIVTRLEVTKLKNTIERIDPNAFYYQTPIRELKGGVVKRRATPH